MDDEDDPYDISDDMLMSVPLENSELIASQLLPPAPEMSTTTPSSSLQSTIQRRKPPIRDPFYNYSPPRVLSQRVVSNYNDNDTTDAATINKTISPNSSNRRNSEHENYLLEFEQLKKENLDLKNRLRERENKEETNLEKCVKVDVSKTTNMEIDAVLDDKRSMLDVKATGVQADMVTNQSDTKKKLLDIWLTSNFQDPRRTLMSKLGLACSEDFEILLHAAKTSNFVESGKISQLNKATREVGYGSVNLKSFVELLIYLCKAENTDIVHRSLRVLRVLFGYICGVEKRFEARDSVTNKEEASSSSEIAKDKRKSNMTIGESSRKTNTTDWDAERHSLFKLMIQITMTRTEEDVKLEAVSIMNIIMMKTDAYTEREMFVSKEVFETISLLLGKGVSLYVRKEAIRLFFLLLNCPNLLARFDSHPEGSKSPASGNKNEVNIFGLQALNSIFEGLADCLTSPRTISEDLELCRNVVMILAFVASSGNSGYELLSNHKLPKDTNFLMLILHLLIAEIDSESVEVHTKEAIFKARTLLMREILILLNRLVSGSSSSSTILRELTKSRDMASLTVDASIRLSRKRNLLGQPESSIERMRNSEITDLARIFKRRVFAFLGDNMS